MEFVDKKINEALEEELAADENSIRNKTFNSIDRYLVCFISAYRQRDEKGNPVSIETNEKNTQKLSDELREKYGFGYHVHRGYYREENSDIPEYEKSLAVNGYEIHDPQKEKTLIEDFRKIMLTLARQYQQDSIILSIPHCGADLIDVKTNTVVLHFNRLTENQLFIKQMEYGRPIRWVIDSIDTVEKPISKSISQSRLFSSYRKKAVKEFAEITPFEMANLRPKRTGFKGNLWLDELAYKRNMGQSKYRVKYECQGVVLSIEFYDSEPKVIGTYKESDFPDLPKVLRWIELNKGILFKLYNNEDDFDLMDFLEKMKVVID